MVASRVKASVETKEMPAFVEKERAMHSTRVVLQSALEHGENKVYDNRNKNMKDRNDNDNRNLLSSILISVIRTVRNPSKMKAFGSNHYGYVQTKKIYLQR